MIRRLLILLLVVGCDILDPDVRGCTDAIACNFNADANIFDNSCIYRSKDCEGICGGNSIIYLLIKYLHTVR